MTADHLSPPRWAERIASWRLPDDRREFVLGDLDEEFRHRAIQQSRADATRWYWRQAWRTLFGRHPRILTPFEQPPGREPERAHVMNNIAADVRYALRGLRHHPTFALAAVLTLALGVGANAAVFRVAWQVILKPLPYPDASRLVRVWEAYQRNGALLTNTVAPGNFVDWQTDTHSFDGFGAYTALRSTLDLTGSGDPVQLEARYVTGDYFPIFGAAPLAGRILTSADINEGDPAPVVLSERVWRQQFGAERNVIGQSIKLGGVPHTVLGVMPEAFGVSAGATTDVWIGLTLGPKERLNHGGHYLGVVARLKPGVTIDRAIADVQTAALHTRAAFPDSNKETLATVTSIEEERGGTLRQAIGLLSGAAAFVLLIACANLASLQLARGLSRAREFGIRTALGASRGRLMVQLFVESLVVAAIGAAAGLALSSWIVTVLSHVAPATLRAGLAASVDWPTMAAAGALALLSVVLFASAPAWQTATRAGRWINQRVASVDRHAAFVRTILVTGQLALAVMLLVGATLLVTSLSRVLRVDPGFDPDGVLTFDVTVPNRFEPRDQLFAAIFRETQALPGVTAVCAINAVPFDETFNMTYVSEGDTKPVGAFPRTVTPGCFEVLRLRLLAGRLFTSHESTRVGVVTQSFARRAWPNLDPVGRRVHLGIPNGAIIEIIGVVADSLQRSLETTAYPQFYEVASAQSAFIPTTVMVRTSVPPASLFSAVRAAVRRVDPDQPVARLRALDDLVGASTSERRFNLSLLVGFASIALVLSAVGIYGLFAHVVAQRRSEIGIRMALGAVPGTVVRLMLRRAWLAVGVGLIVGLAGTYGLSGVLQHLLFSLSPTDPWIYTGASVALGSIALLAAWIPSRRAASVDPVSALRDAQ